MVNDQLQARSLKSRPLHETYEALALDFPLLSIVEDDAKFWIADLVHHFIDGAHVDFFGKNCLENESRIVKLTSKARKNTIILMEC